jgi:hypothetical protein
MDAHELTYLKELHQVVELTMNISANSNWASDWLNVGLLGKNFLGL